MTTAYDFKFKRLASNEEIDLRAFEGRVLLIVNVASACGYTPQYRELEQLYEAKKDQGLMLIGVPSNDFGRQEPGPESDIEAFCKETYKVAFPMTAKTEIVGPNRHAFYKWVAREAGEAALPRWNFHKYLIGRDGALRETFPSKAAPLGTEMLASIEATLREPPPASPQRQGG